MSRVRDVLPAEKVRCPECGARPWVRCTSASGVSRRPHADREARLKGLRPCPQRGSYQRPVDGIDYDAEEKVAIATIPLAQRS